MAGRKNFDELRKQVRSDPERAARVAQYKAAMEVAIDLAALREKIDMTQTELAELMRVTQENVSRIERSGDLYLSTLPRAKPMRVDSGSLRRTGRLLAELRGRGKDRDWLRAMVDYVHDAADRERPRVRRGLAGLRRRQTEPA